MQANRKVAVILVSVILSMAAAIGLARVPWERFGGAVNHSYNDLMMALLPLPPASPDVVIAGILSEKDSAIYTSWKLGALQKVVEDVMAHKPKFLYLTYPLNRLSSTDTEKKEFVKFLKKYKDIYVYTYYDTAEKDSYHADSIYKELPLVFVPLTQDKGIVRRIIFSMALDKEEWITHPLMDLLNKYGYDIKISDFKTFEYGASYQGLMRYRPLKDLKQRPLAELLADTGSIHDKIVVLGADYDQEWSKARAQSIFTRFYERWEANLVVPQRVGLDLNVLIKKDALIKATVNQTTLLLFLLIFIYICGTVFLSPMTALWWGLGSLGGLFISTIVAYLVFDTIFAVTVVGMLLAVFHFFASWAIVTRYLRQRDKLYAEQDKKLRLQDLQNELIVKSARADLGLQLALQVAHDIRSPLLAIRMVSRSVEVPVGATQKILGESAIRLQNIADSLLARFKKNDFSGAQAGTHIPLYDFLQKIVESYQFSWSKTKFEVEGEKDFGFQVLNHVDLESAICNLLNNSLEAMPDGGHVKIEFCEDEASVKIDIKDDGAGVPSALLPRLFEKGATMGKSNGTGLGLHQVKNSIELLGGTIEYAGTVNENTTGALFTIRLPLQPGRQISLNLKGPIVVVEDSEIHRSRWLQKLRDYDVIVFSKPEDYLTSEVYSKPHNLITDLIFDQSSITGFKLLENSACLKKFLCSSLSSHPDIVKMAGELQAQVLLKSQIENLSIQ